MVVAHPQFSTLKSLRKGYDKSSVDEFVARVLHRVNEDRSVLGMSSHELAMPLFDEARGANAYDEDEVDAWLKDMRATVQQLEKSMREEDLPATEAGARQGSATDMAAPPHYADRFPRVSRAVLGFAAHEVDEAMRALRAAFAAGQAPSADAILGMSFSEEHGGYRQVAVAEALELIAMARRAG